MRFSPCEDSAMARTINNSTLESRTARSRLRVRHKPYFRLIDSGFHLGYRKLVSGPGTWTVRRYIGAGNYTVKNLTTADGKPVIADDFAEPDGDGVLSFTQAHARAKAQRGAEPNGGYNVANAMDDYIAFLAENRSTAADARYRYRAFIRPEFGKTELQALTTEKLESWLQDHAKRPPRLRTRNGDKQKFGELSNDDESKRRRRSSANRTWTVFKAALNRAWKNGKVTSNLAWHRVETFHDVDKARSGYLSVAQARRLIDACAADFRKIVQAALLTGARYGQLAELTAADFNSKNNCVQLRTRKSDGKQKAYRAALTQEGARFFRDACAGLAATDVIFRKDDGTHWGKSHQNRLMAASCKRAKISPPVTFQQLRHTWAAHAVINGVPLPVVAANLGHSGTAMVEKHYRHLAPSHIADAIRAGAPKFGFKPDNKTVAHRSRIARR
jgi:integrase